MNFSAADPKPSPSNAVGQAHPTRVKRPVPLAKMNWRSSRNHLILGFLLIILAHLAMMAATQHTEDLAVRSGLKQMESSVIGLEAWMHRSIEGASLALDWMQQRQDVIDSKSGDKSIIEKTLSDLVASHNFDIINAVAIDNDGIGRWAVISGGGALDLHDRSYFIRHSKADVGTDVTDLLTGRAVNAPVVILSRTLQHLDGSMAGVAMVAIDPVALSRHLADLVPPPTQRAAIWRDGGHIIVHNSWRTAADVASEPPPPGMVAAISGRDAASLRKRSRHDGRDVLIAMHRMRDLNLVVSVGIETTSVIGGAAQLRDLVWVADASLVILLLLTVNLDRQRRGRKKASRAVEIAIERERRIQATQEEVNRVIATFPGTVYRARYETSGLVAILYLSQGFTAMTGWPVAPSATEQNGRTILNEALYANREQSDARLMVANQRTYTFERLVECADGSVRHMRFTEHEVSANDDRIEVVGLVTDIEAERLNSANAVVSARLSMLGEMATGLAHEMSQPLSAISLITENALISLNRKDQAAAQAKLEKIPSLVQRASTIIDHLRQFGRQQNTTAAAVPVERAIDGALLLLGGSIREAGIALEVAIEPGLGPVLVSQVLLEQVLVNLLLNARDALISTPRETRSVIIAATKSAKFVDISVTDTGPGIPESVLGRVFEPFFTTKPVGVGTGLGLSVCHGIIESFGGIIIAENLPTGARLTVRLPAISSMPKTIIQQTAA